MAAYAHRMAVSASAGPRLLIESEGSSSERRLRLSHPPFPRDKIRPVLRIHHCTMYTPPNPYKAGRFLARQIRPKHPPAQAQALGGASGTPKI